MTGLTAQRKELIMLHDPILRYFESLDEINITLMSLREMIYDDIEIDADRDYLLGAFLPFDLDFERKHGNGWYSQARRLYGVLYQNLYGVYAIGSLYTLNAVDFKREGPYLIVSIDTRWKYGTF